MPKEIVTSLKMKLKHTHTDTHTQTGKCFVLQDITSFGIGSALRISYSLNVSYLGLKIIKNRKICNGFVYVVGKECKIFLNWGLIKSKNTIKVSLHNEEDTTHFPAKLLA